MSGRLTFIRVLKQISLHDAALRNPAFLLPVKHQSHVTGYKTLPARLRPRLAHTRADQWQRIGNQCDAAFVFAWPKFVRAL